MTIRALKRTRDPVVQSPSAYPDYIAPCLATDIGRPPTGPKWVHEIKFDGFRSQLHLRNDAVTIYSRGGHDWTDRYRSVADQAVQLNAKHLVIDGEMVVLREDGTCDYWALHKGARGSLSDRVTYFAFDLLYQDGEDLRRRPFLARKELLRKALKTSSDRIRYVEHFESDGPTVWAHAHKINVEGIVSKRIDSPYRSTRGMDWIKTPCQYREILVVAGMAFDGSVFSGLYLARWTNGALVYAGKVEDGFSEETVARLRLRLDPLVNRRQPVATASKPNAMWLEPIVKVRILHRGGLTAERVRRPIFEGFVEQA
ncbi:MAG: non-homologous end-joining DNA ligase [Xanthobacteraceae bacterium]